MAKTVIQVETDTRELLKEQGKMGETYDSLIVRLLAELEKLRNGKENKW